VTGVEVLAAAAVAYLVRKLRRVGGRADAEVDRALEAGMDALHDLVSTKLGDDAALAALQEQVTTGGESERTVRRVTDAIAEVAETDEGFAATLQQLIGDLQRRDGSAGGVVASGERSVAIGGDNSGIVSTGDGATNVQQRAEASGSGRVYQAGRDQSINER
jgi:hypothetical protein